MEKPFNLEDRTYLFAKSCRDFVKSAPRSIVNIEYAKQLTRSSASVAVNYIEASERLSKKDFILRIKICRKEAKESILWLKLLDATENLISESTELMKIFGSIVTKSTE